MNKYWCVYRPPDYGAIPIGRIAGERFDWPHAVDGVAFGWRLHGWVAYEQPLTFKQVRSYELLPDDELDRHAMLLWEKKAYDVERAMDCLTSEYEFVAQDYAAYVDYAKGDEYGASVLWWYDHGKTAEDLRHVLISRGIEAAEPVMV